LKRGKLSKGSFTIFGFPSFDTGFTILEGGVPRPTGAPANISDPLALLVGAPHIPNAVSIAGRMLAWLVGAVSLAPHRETATRFGLVTARFCKHGGWEEEAEQEDKSTHLSNCLLISIFIWIW